MFEEVAEGAKRIAGRVIVGGALGLVALAPLPASAQQQVAANGVAPQHVSISPQCASIKDIALQTACEVQHRDAADLAKIRAGTQSERRVTQAANDDSACIDTIKNRIAERKIDPQALSNYLQGRRPSHPDIGGGCKLLAKFTPASN